MDLNLLTEKWEPVLNSEDVPAIKDRYRKKVTALMMENTEKALKEESGYSNLSLLAETPTNSAGTGGYTSAATAAGPVAGYDPVLISLIRRAMPNLIAYDICGVQPMTGPTGLIFAIRSRYANNAGTEAFYNEANTAFGAQNASTNGFVSDTTIGLANGNIGTTPSGNSATYNFRGGMTTAQLEALGNSANNQFAEMAFSIEKVTVAARGRALKAEYSMELAQDLKAVHGLEAQQELANILQTELLAEINREVVRTIFLTAVTGAQNTTVPGTFNLDVDSNGRWLVERFKGMLFQLEIEANQIAKETRRGRGNILICSSNVASALQMAGILDYTPAIAANNGLLPDDTGNTFIGVLNGRIKVYIDPYAVGNFAVMGFKGPNPMDSGLFYAPYVPLQMVTARDPNSFQPKIGFKTRYGMVANPFSRGETQSDGSLIQNSNVYYRRMLVENLI